MEQQPNSECHTCWHDHGMHEGTEIGKDYGWAHESAEEIYRHEYHRMAHARDYWKEEAEKVQEELKILRKHLGGQG